MLKKTVSGIMLILLLTSMLTLAINIQTVKASGTIYIRADGSIDPPTAPITTVDNVTYTLTGDITSDTDGIVIERNNMTLDGGGYIVQGTGAGVGVYLPSGRSNVTIKNMEIARFDTGIVSDGGSSITVSGNNITNNTGNGVYTYTSDSDIENLTVSNNMICNNHANGLIIGGGGEFNKVFNNLISGQGWMGVGAINQKHLIIQSNVIKNNTDGIQLLSSESIISANTLANNSGSGIMFGGAIDSPLGRNNTINLNDIVDNQIGIYLIYACYIHNNLIYHNGIRNNVQQLFVQYGSLGENTWDDGYPSGGNYWSDYTGLDLYSGPYQNVTGSDGKGDTPYVIDANNRDRYPLMNPWIPKHDVALTDIRLSKTVVGQGYSANVTVTMANQGDFREIFNVTLYANSNLTINENGLVGYWKFDEGSGTTAYDTSGNNNDGTLINGPTWVDGKYGKALRFDGIDDYVEIPDSPELKLNESKGLTIMLWFYRTSYPQYDNVLVSKQVYPGLVEYQLDLINTGDLEFKTWDSGYNAVIGSASVPDANKWYHVAYVMNDTHWDFYVNGTLENSGTTSYDLYISNSNLTIGKDIGGAAFNGTMDEVKIYNRTLTANEIWAEYMRTGLGSRFALQTQTVTLESGASTTITFTWNTAGYAKGNYTISAYASPVLGETHTADNTFTNGWIIVSMVGDVTGPKGWPDGQVDMLYDIRSVALLFGVEYPDSKYVANYDINGDGHIDMLNDIRTVAKQFGKTDP